MPNSNERFIDRLYSYLLKFVCIFILAILIRIFLFEIYTVTSNSMEGTLIQGDKILVCKLCYGSKLPNSLRDIPWINLLTNCDNNHKTYSNNSYPKNIRLKGISAIDRNDVVVFTPTTNKNSFHVKRCIGLNGDTIHIKHGIVYVNNKEIEIPNEIKNRYRLWINDISKFKDLLDKLNHQGWLSLYNDKTIQGELLIRKLEKGIILNDSSVDSFKIVGDELKIPNNIIPQGTVLNWTSLNYGPLWIPAKNKILELTGYNSFLYKSIIEKDALINPDNNHKHLNLNGNSEVPYLFKQNYYFLMGDNRSRSFDSRNYGFISEDKIIGRALLIVFNYNNGKFSLKRTLMKIK